MSSSLTLSQRRMVAMIAYYHEQDHALVWREDCSIMTSVAEPRKEKSKFMSAGLDTAMQYKLKQHELAAFEGIPNRQRMIVVYHRTEITEANARLPVWTEWEEGPREKVHVKTPLRLAQCYAVSEDARISWSVLPKRANASERVRRVVG